MLGIEHSALAQELVCLANEELPFVAADQPSERAPGVDAVHRQSLGHGAVRHHVAEQPDRDLGPRADLGKLYFNLPRDVSGLAVETLGDVQRAFDLRPGRRARGGNGTQAAVGNGTYRPEPTTSG